MNKLSNQEKNNQNISENIKNGAGAVFHSVHKGLEATENAAMNAVDTTANAIDNLTDNDKR
ncbi:hypothetical protein [Bacillus sp. SLBN-46]|uniref:hypothetical protein n=1 Tax=Bacillus sp. SLBN-46 TaxID=3042283 RepID=UPI00286C399A|nr:hypothetical protein [Bacillus sp. SLBN-46]